MNFGYTFLEEYELQVRFQMWVTTLSPVHHHHILGILTTEPH